MIISSWNVNSVRARIENIKEYLNKFSPDILMMQEIKTPDETYPYDDIKNLKYENYVFGQKSYNGVAIISKKKLDGIKNDKLIASSSNNLIKALYPISWGSTSQYGGTDLYNNSRVLFNNIHRLDKNKSIFDFAFFVFACAKFKF